jgi:ABC-2 type transport system ATP-binding protein
MTTPAELVVDVQHLGKRFGRATALTSIDLAVAPGQVHGFLGPNGSGKSTTLRILLGLLRKSTGHALVFGHDPWRDCAALHRRIAYIPGDVTLWPSLTGAETIEMLGRLRGSSNRTRLASLIDEFHLDPSQSCRSYSKGNRQKVALVAAFASEADLLVLDEPTAGLDPLMERAFRSRVHEATGRGVTVLLSSHMLSDVEKLCDTVTIIREGRTIDSGRLADMQQLSRVTIEAKLSQSDAVFPESDGVRISRRDHADIQLQVAADRLTDVLGVLAELGVDDLQCRRPSLEEIFLRHYDQPSVLVPA